MRVQESAPNGQEVGVSGIVDLDLPPRVLASSDTPAANLENVFRSDNSERHQPSKLCILLHSVLVVLFDIVRKVVDWDAVVLDVLHDQLLGLCQLSRCQRVGLANDRNDVDAWLEPLHEFDIEFSEAMAGWCDKVEERVDTVVAESGITLDTRLLRENVVVLSLEVANDFAEGGLVVDLIAEAGCVDDCQ
jgi:hypothetical protein